jgi:hypothetical protein
VERGAGAASAGAAGAAAGAGAGAGAGVSCAPAIKAIAMAAAAIVCSTRFVFIIIGVIPPKNLCCKTQNEFSLPVASRARTRFDAGSFLERA